MYVETKKPTSDGDVLPRRVLFNNGLSEVISDEDVD